MILTAPLNGEIARHSSSSVGDTKCGLRLNATAVSKQGLSQIGVLFPAQPHVDVCVVVPATTLRRARAMLNRATGACIVLSAFVVCHRHQGTLQPKLWRAGEKASATSGEQSLARLTPVQRTAPPLAKAVSQAQPATQPAHAVCCSFAAGSHESSASPLSAD